VPPEFMPKPFHCDVAERDDAIHLRPRGELDMRSVPVLEEQLRRARDAGGPRRLVVDLRELEFMDSTGLTLLARWSRGADQDGYDLALIRGEDRVHRLFEITGMAAYFAFVDG
jgi:anti-sigma B factor antagonist